MIRRSFIKLAAAALAAPLAFLWPRKRSVVDAGPISTSDVNVWQPAQYTLVWWQALTPAVPCGRYECRRGCDCNNPIYAYEFHYAYLDHQADAARHLGNLIFSQDGTQCYHPLGACLWKTRLTAKELKAVAAGCPPRHIQPQHLLSANRAPFGMYAQPFIPQNSDQNIPENP